MKVEIFAAGEEFFIRLPGGAGALRWFCRDGRWLNERGGVPDEARAVEIGDLPGDLLEEVLAFITRAEAMGNQIWSSQN